MGWSRNALASAIKYYAEIKQSRVLTASITSAESLTIEGKRFNATADFTLAGGATKYIMYQMPNVASGVVVGLQNRIFKSLNGSAEIEILWNSAGVTLGAVVPSFNENRNSSVVAGMVINEATAVQADGLVRESDFLQGEGSGSNSSGSISSALGFRIYSPDSFFVAKVTNLHSQNNRILLTYSWGEIENNF